MGISRQQALDCFRSDDLIGIGMEAEVVRRRLHPEGVVSYAVEDRIDCTDVMRDGTCEGNQLAVASLQSLYDEICQTLDLGSTGLRLVGGLGSGSKVCGLEWSETLLRGIRQHFPSLWIEGLSASGIVALAAGSGLDLRQIILRLRDAGLDSIASDDTRPKCSFAEWTAVHRAAHGLGMRTVATMVFAAGEALEQRVDLLQAVRQLQEETGGFTAFIPLAAEDASGRELDALTAVEQLKALAIARIFLDNIENIQWSGAAQGLKVLQMGLRFGANDAGSVAPSANGTAAANSISEEDLRRIIRDASFQPVQRDTPYRTMFFY